MNMKVNNEKQYIHIERDNKEEHIIIDAKNISSEDAIYLLTEFIYFVTNQENVPADGFVDIIKKAVIFKTELEKRNE